MRKSGAAPDLAGGWLVRADVPAERVVLLVDAIPRFGLRFTATVVFHQVTAVDGYDARLPDVPARLAGGQRVDRVRSAPGGTVLDLSVQTGPGDTEFTQITIQHGPVTASWQVNAGQSVRAWLGFYPLPRDLRRD